MDLRQRVRKQPPERERGEETERKIEVRNSDQRERERERERGKSGQRRERALVLFELAAPTILTRQSRSLEARIRVRLISRPALKFLSYRRS